MRLRLSLVSLAAALLACAGPTLAHAQGAKDSALVRGNTIDLDSIARDKTAPAYSKRAQARIRARDSLFLVRTASTTPPVTPPPVVEPPKTDPPPVVVVPPTQPPPVTPPPTQPPTVPPSATTVGPATVATLPLVTPNTPYPSSGRAVKVCATCDLQAALNNAQGGDILLLAPGATYSGNFSLPAIASANASAWVVVRTDTSLSTGSRMTPSAASSLRLAKIVTPSYTWAIGTNPSAHHWRITGVEITAAANVPEVNMLVRLGDSGLPQTSLAGVPTSLVLDRVYVHGVSSALTARCVALNSGTTEIVDSWIADCHHSGKDSQGVWGSNGPGPYRIQNNHIEGGHQALFFGGSNPAIAQLIPSDITVVGNHLTRPVAWKGVWQTKTILETKNARRMLIEGNVIENVWVDAQRAFAFLLKSENQAPDCGAPWTQTSDVTIRYNRIRNAASGFNIAANPGTCPAINAARFFITDNIIEPFNGTGDGTPLQFLGPLADVIAQHNTFATAGLNALSLDAAPNQRVALHSNVLPSGSYGAKGSNYGVGNPSIAYYLPGALFANNALVGADCSQYPATTLCALPAVLPIGYDGRAIGADTAAVNAATRNVVVAP